MNSFQIVLKEFSEAGCTLLTTEEEYEAKRKELKTTSLQGIRFNFIGICNHPSSAVFTNFKTRRTGLYYKSSVKKNFFKKMPARNSDSNMECEKQSIELLFNSISEVFDCKKTKEGCLADVLIRPKGSFEDNWILIQVKSTNKMVHKMYSSIFNSNKESYHCNVSVFTFQVFSSRRSIVVKTTSNISSHSCLCCLSEREE